MNHKTYIANAVCWAAAIIASAIIGAPAVFTVLLLPGLASCALIVTWEKSPAAPCRS
jgi:hypothetical protein